MSAKQSDDDSLFSWNLIQGHILTGAGKLDKLSVPNKHFQHTDLPHFLLSNKITRKQFKKWKSEGKISNEIIGAWSRPLFSGGWTESTNRDTTAYNLQSPSIFIDMRVPLDRPDRILKQHSSLNECSNLELRYLSRQHCFGGYSFPEDPTLTDMQEAMTFTRHHIIDWNYHPAFPRSRPNRWFIEVQEPSKDSFKEYSTIRDENKVPVYFERWQRRQPVLHQQTKYLVLRRQTLCPLLKKQQNFSGDDRDALLVVVGNHFTLCVDRDYSRVVAHMTQHLSAPSKHTCKGSGPLFVDHLLASPDLTTSSSEGVQFTNRDVAVDYLELEGSYGLVYGVEDSTGENTSNTTLNHANWRILKSTLPWKEGRSAVSAGEVSLQFNNKNDTKNIGGGSDLVRSVTWNNANNNRSANRRNNNDNSATRGNNDYCAGSWEVLECSFSRSELQSMFHLSSRNGGNITQHPRSRL